jgi:hypothetical protein
MPCNIKVKCTVCMVKWKNFAWQQHFRTRNTTLTRINDAIRSRRSPLVYKAARMNAEGGMAPVCWHYNEGLSLHGVLPSLAGGERPGRCDLYCDGRSVPACLAGSYRLPSWHIPDFETEQIGTPRVHLSGFSSYITVSEYSRSGTRVYSAFQPKAA